MTALFSELPEDIFTEQEDINPDTLAALGPLAFLAGTWEGTVGQDTSPKADGPERKPFTERIILEPIDAQSNGPQLFYGLRYHTTIYTPEEPATFHDQVGYWLYEPDTGTVIQTLTIPRGQTAIAGGKAEPGAKRLVLTARRGDTEYGICSNPFLERAFRTDSYKIEIVINDNETWSYTLETTLQVEGQGTFLHRDVNTLKRVSAPVPNPLSRRQASD